MGRRTIELRARAADDIERAVDYYFDEAGASVALRFIDAVEHAVGRISRAPLTGTLRFSYELGIPDLRAWPLDRFPYLMFYVAGVDRVEVWRVLHTRRNLPAAMAEEVDDR